MLPSAFLRALVHDARNLQRTRRRADVARRRTAPPSTAAPLPVLARLCDCGRGMARKGAGQRPSSAGGRVRLRCRGIVRAPATLRPSASCRIFGAQPSNVLLQRPLSDLQYLCCDVGNIVRLQLQQDSTASQVGSAISKCWLDVQFRDQVGGIAPETLGLGADPLQMDSYRVRPNKVFRRLAKL